MPTLGFHVSDGSTLDARVKARARETHDGKVSAYVRSAVERDLNGDTGSVISADVITSLATKLLGERKAATLKPYLDGQDQPELLEAMLQRFFEETTGIKGRHHEAVLKQALQRYEEGKKPRTESPPADKAG